MNKSYPGLSAENYPTAATHGTITHVARIALPAWSWLSGLTTKRWTTASANCD